MPVQLPPATVPWIEQKNRYVPRRAKRRCTDCPGPILFENFQLPPYARTVWVPDTARHRTRSRRSTSTTEGRQRVPPPLTTAAVAGAEAAAVSPTTSTATTPTRRIRMPPLLSPDPAGIRIDRAAGSKKRRRWTERLSMRATSCRSIDLPGRARLRYLGAMAPDHDDLTLALSEAKQRRATLHDALVHLEIAISSPAASRIPEWTALVTKEVTGVRDAFEQHVLVTEKPGGLYEEIIMRAPRLDGTLKRLRDEHPDISSSIEQMLDRLEHTSIGGPDWPLEDARDDLQRFIGRVIRHRQKGADLVWEAYNVDIGGTE